MKTMNNVDLLRRNLQEVKPSPFRAAPAPKSTFIAPKRSQQLENEYDRHREHARENIRNMLSLEKRSRVYYDDEKMKSDYYYQKKLEIKLERIQEVERTKFMEPRIPLEVTFKVARNYT